MTTRIALTHTLAQRFERRVLLPTHWLRLRPAPHTKAPITAYSLKIDTDPHFINWVRDPFENHLARLDLPEPVFGLKITLDLIADLKPLNPFDFLVEAAYSQFPFEYPEQLRKELTPYLHLPEPGMLLADWLGALTVEPGYILEALGKITTAVHRHLAIAGHASPGAVDLETVLAKAKGSPWEAAWLLVLSFRHLGLAARFTSGYRVLLAQEPVAVHAWGQDAPATTSRWLDSAGLHAWCEVFLPGAGWVGLDPAAGLFIHEGYLPLASTPDPLRALPWCADEAEWLASAGAESAGLSGEIRVRRLAPEADPAPYSAAQWADLRAVARQVDARLAEDGIGLAMGPSLCFTKTDCYAPDWSILAMGPSKRAAAEDLALRLGRKLNTGPVFHESQGEWFGGENLPRWRLSCFYRADGHPVWRNPALLVGAASPESGVEAPDAEYFAHTLAKKLGVAQEYLKPAYEDQLHELWQNRAHLDFEPPTAALRDPLQRRALAAKLSQTRREPVGYVLPLRWDPVAERWTSGTWEFRRGALYLAPGDSPLGYRLPLDSLPVGEDHIAGHDPERCHFEERPLLPEVYGELSARLTTYIAVPPPPEQADPERIDSRAPRTALCVQVREGRLSVFLPPLTHLEHWLDLIHAIEAAAFGTGIPVRLEGYEPPEDFRLRRLVLEPEAGVLRVALPVADSLEETRGLLDLAYREAAALGLYAGRHDANGRPQAPGGHAEITLGGTRPPASPFLLRPQLLHSLVAYWQRHPSLSYLFAGRLIGPSGTAPRPDEGRDDALYELDIALSRMPLDDSPGPWIPDRVLRHLLADPAGEMKRAEIRVDQLYSPDRSSHRLGRIAIRSFETAPDAALATAQTLLLAALLAHLARHPADPRLEDWGPQLQDRFMLPAVLWEDLREVIRDIGRGGIPLQAEWFAPFLERRFPALGRTRFDNLTLDLRMAHEPWPLLSEEVTAGGVSRFVDSANQRVQIEIEGFTPALHVLVCNGQRVPLQATRERGRFVAGVRYKAWNPPSSLHPTVPPVAALVFDLLDARTGEVICGCTYVPARPDIAGAVAVPPVPPEAEPGGGSAPYRRRPQEVAQPPSTPGGRFLDFGSGTRYLAVPPERFHPRFPYLLDLVRG
ncbi:transglutaminase family protein [Methylomagnum ishizawai]|uniref:transglutaminase family protein n=1 Tax=Methylomagnum ishizawai TaxID=1760988 RepID=UPI001C336070|nr:transglutaminase family protein [Methylomagnum ishizawai]BBL75531.1 IMP dehydrogenase [Methylomagnum ishizawai]